MEKARASARHAREQTPAALLEAAVAADPGRPLVTFYDDATAERVELSAATLANWVAKTAGMLTDELGVEPGAPVRLALPMHWLQAVWALAVWRVGAVVDIGVQPVEALPGGLLVWGTDSSSAQGRGSAAGVCDAVSGAGDRETVAVSLAPLGAPFPPGSLPAGVLDFARQVPMHPDRFDGPRPTAQDPAVRADGREWTGAEAVAYARDLSATWGLGPGGRLLAGDELHAVPGLLAATLVPLCAGGSVVLVRHATQATTGTAAARAESERVTAFAPSD